MHRGTRQGCPLSHLLFAITIEPLAIAMRNDSSILGIQRDQMHKVSLFADDLLIFISDPLTRIPKFLTLLKDFGTFSGYKLNLHKSELIPINTSADECSLSSLPLKVLLKKLTYLGVVVTQQHNDLFKCNFLPLLGRTNVDLEHWSGLPLSLAGRINAVKINNLPKFYTFSSRYQFIFKKNPFSSH